MKAVAKMVKAMIERGLRGARLIICDRRFGMVEAAHEVSPEAKVQRRIAHFYRNVSSKVPHSKRDCRDSVGSSQATACSFLRKGLQDPSCCSRALQAART